MVYFTYTLQSNQSLSHEVKGSNNLIFKKHLELEGRTQKQLNPLLWQVTRNPKAAPKTDLLSAA